MRAAIVSDPHVNLRSRREEARRVLPALVEDLRAREVDLILKPGDLWEELPDAEEEDWAARLLRDAADVAEIVGCTGNHDIGCPLVPRLRLPCSEHHAPRHPITIVDRPQVVYAAGAAIACLPWPRAGHLLAAAPEAGKEERYHAAIAALRVVLLGLRQELERHDGPRILIAHAHVRGARLGSHVPDRADFNLGLEELGLVGADFIGLAHLHEHQAWVWREDGREVPIVYPGSPFANTWGETERKGYVIADFEDGRGGLRGWEFVPTIARPLVHAGGAFKNGVIGERGAVAGAEVRLRFDVAPDQRAAAMRAAEEERERLLAAGAARVVLEPIVQPAARARMPEITTQGSVAGQLATWLEGQGTETDRVQRLRGMVEELEGANQ